MNIIEREIKKRQDLITSKADKEAEAERRENELAALRQAILGINVEVLTAEYASRACRAYCIRRNK